MKSKVLFLLLILFVSGGAAADTVRSVSIDTSAHSVMNPDQEMIDLLVLKGAQVPAYIQIMHTQREAFLSSPNYQWQRKLAIYKETVRMLSGVLTDVQLAQFEAYMGCLLEEEASQYSQL